MKGDEGKVSNEIVFRVSEMLKMSFKVHMKRIFTVAFHLIIVKINIKES